MRLESVKYSHFEDKPQEWNLDPLTFGAINLIVGKNASGKTKALNIINNLALLLRGERKPDMTSANFSACFEHEKKKYKYFLNIENHVVVQEKFEINGEERLTRSDDGVGKIYAEKLGEKIDFQTPVTELAFTARRDKLQHSYFEPLYEWAESVYHYAFGSPLGREKFFVSQQDGTIQFNPRDTQGVVSIYKQGEIDFGNAFKQAVKSDLAKIGYDISDLGIDVPQNMIFTTGLPGKILGLWIKEKGLKSRVEQMDISQGMFRALSLIIQINYSNMALKKPGCILIDDIGEGLDFERSCSLIDVLISKARESKVQLIMTTNDRFVMNKVPLETWTVLVREGTHCRVFNINTDKEKFEDFRFTGLSNFDFFATNYLNEIKNE